MADRDLIPVDPGCPPGEDASDIEFEPFGSIEATNVQDAIEEVASEVAAAGAPTNAPYLTTVAVAGLSAEVPVGATPGGELGGTWAAPTVDASHSGSTHAATQAAAEATAAAALSSGLAGKVDKATLDANSVLYAVTDDTPAALAVAASRVVGRKATGDVVALTAAELLAILGRVAIRKAADEIVNNSAVLQDDDELQFAIAANETWVGRIVVFHLGDSTADIKFAVTVPAGAALLATTHHPLITSVALQSVQHMTTSGVAISSAGNAATGLCTIVYFSVANGVTAGNVVLQWAQNVQTVADTTVKAGSFLTAERI